MAKVVSLAILMWAMGSITTMTFNGMVATWRAGADGSGNAPALPAPGGGTQHPAAFTLCAIPAPGADGDVRVAWLGQHTLDDGRVVGYRYAFAAALYLRRSVARSGKR